MIDLDLFERLSFFADLNEEERGRSREAREFDTPEESAALENLESAAPRLTDDQVAELISPEARDFVISFEIGSKALYERKYKQPIWPGGASGLTIGIGYDVGVQSEADLRRTWTGLLPAEQTQQLCRAVGVDGRAAEDLCREMRNIVVPWDVAIEAYRRSTMPIFGRKVLATFPNATQLHPHSFGALFSLVFNRGARLNDRPGSPSRQHMREIRDLMADGTFDQIPRQFRLMKDLWRGKGLDGLIRRREAEAVLFQDGLDAKVTPRQGSLESLALERVDSAHDGDAIAWEEDTEETLPREQLEAVTPWAGVAWSVYEASPDYRHIGDYSLKGKAFTFSGADLEFLLKANSFAPTSETGAFIFGLRGAQLILSLEDKTPATRQVDRESLILKEVAPDHEHFRCVIGVYNPVTKRLSGFAASTVPCRRAVSDYKATQRAGNMTATGLYRFTVDWHNKSRPERAIPGCLHEGGRQKAVWRSVNNLSYDLEDRLENHQLHGNNVHPSLVERSAEFSSYGCLVVQGNYKVTGSDRSRGEHLGEWARFRQALGLTRAGTGDHGKQVDMVVLTGLEAALASHTREGGAAEPVAAMLRLRQGSQSPRVALLETALGLPATERFSHKVMKALAAKQKTMLGFNDGVYSPEMEERLGLSVFGTEIPPAPPETLESVDFDGASEEDFFLQQIGLRATLAEHNPDSLGMDVLPYESVILEGTFGDMKALGARIFRRVERSLYTVLCGDNPEDASDRQRFVSMLNDAAPRGREAVKEVVQWMLTAALLLPVRVAEPVAELIVRRVLEPAFQDLASTAVRSACRGWAMRLREAEEERMPSPVPIVPAQ